MSPSIRINSYRRDMMMVQKVEGMLNESSPDAAMLMLDIHQHHGDPSDRSEHADRGGADILSDASSMVSISTN